jgi:hydrogenase-4 component B
MVEVDLIFSLFFQSCCLGVLAAAFLPERHGPTALAWTGGAASLAIVLVSGQILLGGAPFQLALWSLPVGGTLQLRMDSLSALFVCITGMVFLPVSIFSTGYLKRYLGRYSLRSFAIFFHLLFASIVVVLLAGDVISFFLAWEAMSLLSYLLVNYEHEDERNTRAGFLMLAMGEVGTLAAAIAFLIMAKTSGSLDFASLKIASLELSGAARWGVFLLAIFGFGVKAGLVPLGSWLPKAHPAAPGNVSALLSGIILNLGIYGILRVNGDLLPVTHLGQGLIVLSIGSLSALIGILYATTRNNIKTMLAHSSIENMGIVTAGLGAGFVFMTSGYQSLAGIAFIAALYHMMNHALYKSLLFLGASAVDTSVGTRNMEHLGGLIRAMPWTSLAFLVGALSIAALPPFNGFVSEWLTLQTMLRSAAMQSTGVRIVFALCGAGLALTAALAVTCFVKAFAMSFLGMARSQEAERAREVRRSMTIPMGVLALCCLLSGILPTYIIPVLDRCLSPVVRVSVADELVPPFFTVEKGDPKFDEAFVSEFHDLGAQVGRGLIPGRGLVVLHRGSKVNPVVFAMSTSYTLPTLIVLLVGAYVGVRVFTRKRKVSKQAAWDGGVRRLLPEMTYTATGFSNPVRVIFNAIFRPLTVGDSRETVAEHFRTAIRNGRSDVHIVDRSVFHPVVRVSQWAAAWLGRMHRGSVNVYAAYVLMSLVSLVLILLFL